MNEEDLNNRIKKLVDKYDLKTKKTANKGGAMKSKKRKNNDWQVLLREVRKQNKGLPQKEIFKIASEIRNQADDEE